MRHARIFVIAQALCSLVVGCQGASTTSSPSAVQVSSKIILVERDTAINPECQKITTLTLRPEGDTTKASLVDSLSYGSVCRLEIPANERSYDVSPAPFGCGS